jgi:hypothetical protein
LPAGSTGGFAVLKAGVPDRPRLGARAGAARDRLRLPGAATGLGFGSVAPYGLVTALPAMAGLRRRRAPRLLPLLIAAGCWSP